MNKNRNTDLCMAQGFDVYTSCQEQGSCDRNVLDHINGYSLGPTRGMKRNSYLSEAVRKEMTDNEYSRIELGEYRKGKERLGSWNSFTLATPKTVDCGCCRTLRNG